MGLEIEILLLFVRIIHMVKNDPEVIHSSNELSCWLIINKIK